MFGKNSLKQLEKSGSIRLLSNMSTNLFEDMLKTHTQCTQRSTRYPEHQIPTLSPDEKNIIQYAAGYVPLKLMKKYEKQSSDVAVEYVECLNSMAEIGDESSLQACTLEWSRIVNRGGYLR